MPQGIYNRTEKTKEKIRDGNFRRYIKFPDLKQKISEKLKGRKHTEETKKKMKKNHKSHKGYIYSEETKNKIRGINNPSKRPEVRIKISEAFKGEKSHFWKGGITPENLKIRASIEYSLWREIIFRRDKYICWRCRFMGNTIAGGNLEAHHIQDFAEYPKLRFVSDNGITFCKECHREFHKIYGVKNNTKGQLLEFLAV